MNRAFLAVMASTVLGCAADRTAPTLAEPKATPAEPAVPVTPVPPVDSTPPAEPDTLPIPATVVSVTVLPSLGGGFTFASAISDNGNVTGYSARRDGYHRAFLWTASSGIRDLGTLPGDQYTIGYDVNDAGQVVGFSGTETPNGVVTHAFVWSASGGMKAIAGAGVQSVAFGINNRGEVVGGYDAGDSYRAFVWSESAGLRDLGAPAGVTFSTAWAINDSGTVVGNFGVPRGSSAFVWTRTNGMKELPNTGGTLTQATAINDAGLIAGVDGSTSDSTWRAVVWKNGVERDLGSLGGVATMVRTISPDGDVFGESDPVGARYKQHAFVARPSGIRDLHTRTGLMTVFGVNRHLQVVGDSLLVQLRRDGN